MCHRLTPNDVSINMAVAAVRPLLQVVLSRIAYSIANREPIDTHFATEQIKNPQRTKPNFIHFYGTKRIEEPHQKWLMTKK